MKINKNTVNTINQIKTEKEAKSVIAELMNSINFNETLSNGLNKEMNKDWNENKGPESKFYKTTWKQIRYLYKEIHIQMVMVELISLKFNQVCPFSPEQIGAQKFISNFDF